MLHGITPLGNDPEWFKITRFYPEMYLNGANTQWVYSQAVKQTSPYWLRAQEKKQFQVSGIHVKPNKRRIIIFYFILLFFCFFLKKKKQMEGSTVLQNKPRHPKDTQISWVRILKAQVPIVMMFTPYVIGFNRTTTHVSWFPLTRHMQKAKGVKYVCKIVVLQNNEWDWFTEEPKGSPHVVGPNPKKPRFPYVMMLTTPEHYGCVFSWVFSDKAHGRGICAK